jgi:hypothetical protein
MPGVGVSFAEILSRSALKQPASHGPCEVQALSGPAPHLCASSGVSLMPLSMVYWISSVLCTGDPSPDPTPLLLPVPGPC